MSFRVFERRGGEQRAREGRRACSRFVVNWKSKSTGVEGTSGVDASEEEDEPEASRRRRGGVVGVMESDENSNVGGIGSAMSAVGGVHCGDTNDSSTAASWKITEGGEGCSSTGVVESSSESC